MLKTVNVSVAYVANGLGEGCSYTNTEIDCCINDYNEVRKLCADGREEAVVQGAEDIVLFIRNCFSYNDLFIISDNGYLTSHSISHLVEKRGFELNNSGEAFIVAKKKDITKWKDWMIMLIEESWNGD